MTIIDGAVVVVMVALFIVAARAAYGDYEDGKR